MLIFSLGSLITSILVFIGVNYVVNSFNPTNIFYAQVLVILISTIIISVIFTSRQFRHLGKDKWKNQYFHKALLRTFLINFVIIFIFNLF